MKSSRTVIDIGFNHRIQDEDGVWEDNITWKTIKAEEEYIFQNRLDQALADKQKLNRRFQVRSHHIDSFLDYVRVNEKVYKVRSINENINNHYAIIECGELI